MLSKLQIIFYKFLLFLHGFKVRRERKKYWFNVVAKTFDRGLYLHVRSKGYKDWDHFFRYEKSMRQMTKKKEKNFIDF